MKMPDDLKQLLDGCGLPWRIDEGKRHHKLIINDRLATVLPRAPIRDRISGRSHKNLLAQVRRVIRQTQATE